MSVMDGHSEDMLADAAAGQSADTTGRRDSAVGEPGAVAGEHKTAAEYRQAANEHVKTLKDFWKDFLVSGIFILAAIVIIFACLAWFASNNRVSATGSSISAKGARYTLTSVVKDGEKSWAGVYDKQMELDTGTSSMLVMLSSNLNNYDTGGLYPGARGVLSFTVTPLANDLGDITINLSKKLNTKGGDDATLLALLKGHLLMFQNYEGGHYSNRIVDDKITIKKDQFYKTGSTNTTEPVTINLYWIWPEYFQNYVLRGDVGYYRNLFSASENANDDYGELRDYLNGNKTKLYFGTTEDGKTTVANAPHYDAGMPSTELDTCAELYNNADEYIGSNVEFLQLKISANEG